MMKPVLLVISLVSCFLWSACKTSNRTLDSESKGALAISYAAYAQDSVKQSYSAFMIELNKVNPKTAPKELDALFGAVKELSEILEVFVHVLPIQGDSDLYVSLRARLAAGSSYITDVKGLRLSDPKALEARRAPLMVWIEGFREPTFSTAMDEYFDSMNVTLATRRTMPVLEKTFWGKVDFIPNLKGAYDQELKDFMKALIKALRSATARSKAIPNILDNATNMAFFESHMKARSILAITDLFPDVFDMDTNIQGLLPAIEQLNRRYNKLDEALKLRETLEKAQKTREAEDVGEGIKTDWQELKKWQASPGNL